MEKRGSGQVESFGKARSLIGMCNHSHRSLLLSVGHFLVFPAHLWCFQFSVFCFETPHRVIKMFATLFVLEMQMFVNNTCL